MRICLHRPGSQPSQVMIAEKVGRVDGDVVLVTIKSGTSLGGAVPHFIPARGARPRQALRKRSAKNNLALQT